MRSVLAGRGDLVRALAAGDATVPETVARLLGLERITAKRAVRARSRSGKGDGAIAKEPLVAEAPSLLPQTPFWYAKTLIVVQPVAIDDERVEEGEAAEQEHSAPVRRSVPDVSPLASGPAILTRLRRASAFSRVSREPDVERVVDDLSRGRFAAVLPRRSRSAWGPSLHVLVDRNRRLAPYWDDQDDAIRHLSRMYPHGELRVAVLEEGAADFRPCWPRRAARYVLPETGTTVLALSDLGCLASDRTQLQQFWIERGTRYRENGNATLALVPCHPDDISGPLRGGWAILPWDTRATAARALANSAEGSQVVEQIVTLLSFALRVEPRLVREARRVLLGARSDAGIEARVWQHEAFQSRNYDAAAFRADAAEAYRLKVGSLPPDRRQKFYEYVAGARHVRNPWVWAMERATLEREAGAEVLNKNELEDAFRWLEAQRRKRREPGDSADPSSDEAAWFRQVLHRLPQTTYQGRAGAALHEIWSSVEIEGDTPPDGIDPARLPSRGNVVRTIELRQFGTELVAQLPSTRTSVRDLASATGSDGSLIGYIRTRNPTIKVEPFEEEPIDCLWCEGERPAWVWAWGRDRFGPWCTLRVDDVEQRLRWIPPGRFLMGSPPAEAGRDDDEGPQHEVTISRGFWLFDTPCTQCLWLAVMDKNPSEFRSSTRPVETVSWDDCQKFLERLNRRLEGLNLSFPTEAQWEYACRAGSSCATYAGDVEILGDNNAPLLDPIAWYGGNCGAGFELSDGYHISTFPEKQYTDQKGGTHPVGTRAPNDWGLYDMLGNVYERCLDGFDSGFYARSPRSDPMAPAKKAALRVIRGGSWHSIARYVRAAYRRGNHPGNRAGYIGFRCGEFQSSGLVEAATAERGVSGCERTAEHRSARESVSGTRWLNPLDMNGDRMEFGSLHAIRVLSDVEQLVLVVQIRPAWASAIGRDECGLWAEFTLESMVRQRLRWIPPGRFLMGSPSGEAGRFENEGPQRTMRISEGFWVFDTPCSQALWEAVMGENPSEFQSPTRPVEQVSWDDCQDFVTRLNGRLEGLVLSLPSEAQWEYACRAGTTGATYAGDLHIFGDNNAPLLDRIAWYGGNCGVDFELTKGWDISKWEKVQYPAKKGGTHRVGTKAANAWGLYDMLGNVLEWCLDGDESAPRGQAPHTPFAIADRVIRGGSWSSDGRSVRAACRNGISPSSHYVALGFRCSEFRAGEEEREGKRL
jgi:formylglycine-generating enzyme required for sulfatase activity